MIGTTHNNSFSIELGEQTTTLEMENHSETFTIIPTQNLNIQLSTTTAISTSTLLSPRYLKTTAKNMLISLSTVDTTTRSIINSISPSYMITNIKSFQMTPITMEYTTQSTQILSSPVMPYKTKSAHISSSTVITTTKYYHSSVSEHESTTESGVEVVDASEISINAVLVGAIVGSLVVIALISLGIFRYIGFDRSANIRGNSITPDPSQTNTDENADNFYSVQYKNEYFTPPASHAFTK